MIDSTPRFLTGAYAITGEGFDKPSLLDATLVYVVPGDRRAQMIYLRAGNSSGELAALTVMQNDRVARIFPVGAKASVHVPLAVVEDMQPDTRIEVHCAAEAGVRGTIVLDIGLLEI